MYDIISSIINHSWVSNYTGDQQYIYYICGALICLVISLLIDGVFRLLRGFLPRWDRD